MLVAISVFVLVTGGILAGYTLLTRLPGEIASRRLERRLRDLGRPEAAPTSSILNSRREGPLPGVDRLVTPGSWLARLIEQSGLSTTPSAVLLISTGAGVCLALVVFTSFRRMEAAALAGVIGMALPTLFLKYKRSVRLKKFEEQFPEALDLMSRALRAGHAFQTAMGMVAEELRPPVGVEFKKSFEQQNFGLPVTEALTELSERVPLMDVKFFVTAIAIQRETGGNLAEILDNLAHVVRERFKILRQVRVHTAHGRFTAFVLLALPPALAAALSYISPDHMRSLFQVSMGQKMIMGAIVMQTIGFIWIRRIIRIEV